MTHRHHGRATAPIDDTVVRIADVLWRSDELGSSEHCTVARRADGWIISSTTVLPIVGAPGHIAAAIRTDGAWNTVAVTVDVHARRPRRIEIAVQDGAWTVDGRHRRDLDGCVDVDLGWTPATNLLPLRRLGCEVGGEVSVDAAWLRFPDFELERVEQAYRRTAEHRWRYRSRAADHVLDVDELGLVARYADIWTAVSTWSDDGHH